MAHDGLSNPMYGDLFGLGGQWPELRSLVRMHGGNPHAQSRLLETLCSLNALATERVNINLSSQATLEDHDEARVAIAGTISYYGKQFREWREGLFVPDGDFALPPYSVDERLPLIVDRITGDHEV